MDSSSGRGETLSTLAALEAKPALGILGLPSELREQIYEYVVVKEQNTITMLSNYDCHRSEISASQPALARVNHQLRREVLSTFYSNNIFMADLSQRDDQDTAKRWLLAIGETNAGSLRRVTLCGWARVPFGHMICKRWLKGVLNLRDGTLGLEGNAAEPGQHTQVVQGVEQLKTAFAAMVEARAGKSFNVDGIGSLMDLFAALCTVY